MRALPASRRGHPRETGSYKAPPASFRLELVNRGHAAPLVIRADGAVEHIDMPSGRGLGGRASSRPAEHATALEPGDRLILYSDGVITDAAGGAWLGVTGVARAAQRFEHGSAADTVREVHRAVIDANEGDLRDDATVVGLAVE